MNREWRITAQTLRSAAVLAGWAAIVVAWLDRLGGRAQDDVYIIYRYALDLATGHGFVYNPGERVFGLSEPGVGLALAALHRLTGVDVPELGSALFGAALLALALLLQVAAERRGRGPEALLGGTLLMISSLVWISHGAGAPLMLALLVGAAVLLEAAPAAETGRGRRGAVAGVLAGLAVWVRPDAAAAVAILGLLAWLRARRLPVAFGLAGAAVILAGLASAWLYFGAVLPQTLEAKRAASAAFDPARGAADFWRGALDIARRHLGSGLWPLGVLGALGAAVFARRGGLAARTLVGFAVVVAVVYSALRVGLLSWYLMPLVVVLFYGSAFAVGAAARWAAAGARGFGAARRRLAAGLAVILALVAIAPVAVPLARESYRWATAFEGFGRLNAYRDAGDWIRATTPEGARVASLEVGMIGYRSRRPVGDLLGLVSPESIPYVARRDLLGALREQDADLVVARSEGRIRRVVASPWFQSTYEETIRFPTPEGGAWIEVYRRRP